MPLGVDKFLLYDDGSADAERSQRCIVTPLRADAIDRSFPWLSGFRRPRAERAIQSGLAVPMPFRQLWRHDSVGWGSSTLMSFISDPADSLDEVLMVWQMLTMFCLPWQMFGRQGFAETPDRVLPHSVKRYRDPFHAKVKGVLNFKCLVNPSKVTKVYVHGFETKRIQDDIGTLPVESFNIGQHRSPNFHPVACASI